MIYSQMLSLYDDDSIAMENFNAIVDELESEFLIINWKIRDNIKHKMLTKIRKIFKDKIYKPCDLNSYSK